MALDPLPGEISGKVIGARRAELAAAVGPPPGVVGLVPGQDGPQMPFAEDQHPVGDLLAGGEHEPFRMKVRSWAPRRDLHHLDAGIGRMASKAVVNCPARSRDKESEVGGAVT